MTSLNAVKLVDEKMNNFRIADALDDLFNLLRRTNKYIDETTPWVLGKEGGDKQRLQTVIYNLLEAIRFGGILLKPFLPETADKILAQIGAEKTDLDSLKFFGGLESGKKVSNPEIIFARIDAKKFLEQLKAKKEAAKKQENEVEGIIKIDDFAKVNLVSAKILSCVKLEKSQKLYKLIVDNGKKQKQVLSGIANYYTPDELIGKTVILVDNLAPAKLCGEKSEGMLLAADTKDTVKVIFLDNIEPGAKIR